MLPTLPRLAVSITRSYSSAIASLPVYELCIRDTLQVGDQFGCLGQPSAALLPRLLRPPHVMPRTPYPADLPLCAGMPCLYCTLHRSMPAPLPATTPARTLAEAAALHRHAACRTQRTRPPFHQTRFRMVAGAGVFCPTPFPPPMCASVCAHMLTRRAQGRVGRGSSARTHTTFLLLLLPYTLTGGACSCACTSQLRGLKNAEEPLPAIQRRSGAAALPDLTCSVIEPQVTNIGDVLQFEHAHACS